MVVAKTSSVRPYAHAHECRVRARVPARSRREGPYSRWRRFIASRVKIETATAVAPDSSVSAMNWLAPE